MQPILLYWFDAQQQTSLSTRQKLDLTYPNFSSEFNKLSFFFEEQLEMGKKPAKTKTQHKTTCM